MRSTHHRQQNEDKEESEEEDEKVEPPPESEIQEKTICVSSRTRSQRKIHDNSGHNEIGGIRRRVKTVSTGIKLTNNTSLADSYIW